MQSFIPLLLLSFVLLTNSLPLSTNSRWIVNDQTRERVKLVGLNWAGHVGPMLPEGLDKKPLNEIARSFVLMGYNSVRLTYAMYMYTRHANLTVAQSFRDLGLNEAIEGIQTHNPQILGMTLVQARDHVVNALGSFGVMVLLDCHVSEPIWCCGAGDGNGFWGDTNFNPREWLNALTMVAERYRNTHSVVAMSLRNELRGQGQNVDDWYQYVRRGARAIHRANPNLLILVSGFDYDTDLSFLKTRPLVLNINNKLVYEAHRYAFTNDPVSDWTTQPLNHFCDNVIQDIDNKTTFLVSGRNPAPLYVSEFGINMVGDFDVDNNFLTCYLMYLAENDLDWNLWGLQGSYYFKQNQKNVEEDFSMFNTNWTRIRNPQIHEKLLSIQRKFQDPKSRMPRYLRMYHPKSGKCIKVDNENVLHASDCYTISRWSYNGDNRPIRLIGTRFCLTATGEDMPAVLTRDCYGEQSMWTMVSKYQLANKDKLCLHYDPYISPRILTRRCICYQDDPTCIENPQNQWFGLISTNTR